MCNSCGCTSCTEWGAPVEDGVCAGCGEKPTNCTCEPVDEQFAYEEEEEEFEDEDEDEEEDEDYEEEEEEDEDLDDEDDKDW